MEKEFVPVELALRLKALGFDEPCFGKFYYNQLEIGGNWRNNDFKEDADVFISAPTFSQVFRWFREKYELHSCIHSDYTWNITGGIWDLNEYKGSRYDWDSEPYSTYEESELDCLTKLIEIVEKN